MVPVSVQPQGSRFEEPPRSQPEVGRRTSPTQLLIFPALGFVATAGGIIDASSLAYLNGDCFVSWAFMPRSAGILLLISLRRREGIVLTGLLAAGYVLWRFMRSDGISRR